MGEGAGQKRAGGGQLLFWGMKGEVVPGRKGVKWRGLTRCGGHQDTLDVGAWCQRACGSNERCTGSIDSLTTSLVWTRGRGGGVGGWVRGT